MAIFDFPDSLSHLIQISIFVKIQWKYGAKSQFDSTKSIQRPRKPLEHTFHQKLFSRIFLVFFIGYDSQKLYSKLTYPSQKPRLAAGSKNFV